MRWPLFCFPPERNAMINFEWTEDDILYEDHFRDWYEDEDDYDTVAESNGQSQLEDFDRNEEAGYENEIDF